MNRYYFTFKLSGKDRYGKDIKIEQETIDWDIKASSQQEAESKLRSFFVDTAIIEITNVVVVEENQKKGK